VESEKSRVTASCHCEPVGRGNLNSDFFTMNYEPPLSPNAQRRTAFFSISIYDIRFSESNGPDSLFAIFKLLPLSAPFQDIAIDLEGLVDKGHSTVRCKLEKDLCQFVRVAPYIEGGIHVEL